MPRSRRNAVCAFTLLLPTRVYRLTVGESFFQVSEEEAVEHLEKSTKMTEDMLAKYVDEAESARVEMEALKKVLYAKFGANINLEDR